MFFFVWKQKIIAKMNNLTIINIEMRHFQFFPKTFMYFCLENFFLKKRYKVTEIEFSAIAN